MERRAGNGPSAEKDPAGKVDTNRRQALVKLGIGAGIAYIAPSVLRIERPAYASVTPTTTEEDQD